MTGAAVDTAEPRSLWRAPDFTRLWTAHTASVVGTRVSTVAIPLFAVSTLAATPWDMGLLNTVQNVGIILVGLPAGAWVDRIRRRRLMLTMDLLRAGLLAAIPIAALSGHAGLGLLFAVAFGVSVASAFFDIAQQAYMPALVGTGRVVEANAKIQASQAVAVAAGPGVGGALVDLLNAANTVLATCLTYLVSWTSLSRIRAVEPAPEPGERRGLRAEIAEGLRYVLGDPALRAIAFCTASANLFMSMIVSIVVLYLATTVGLSAFGVGLVLATSGVGGALAALTVRRIAARLGTERTIWLSSLLTQPFALLLPWGSAALFVAGWFVLGYGGTAYNIVQVSYRQASCPSRLLGRVQASNRFFAWGTLPIGGLLGGWAGTQLGLRGAIAVAAVGLIVSSTWLTASPLPGGRRRRPGVLAQSTSDTA